MWATTAAVALLASFTVVSSYTVRVDVPAEPAIGDRVMLQCIYTLRDGEHIQEMIWDKDGKVFMTYRQEPEEYTFTSIRGIDVDEKKSTQRRVILNDVQDSASGRYGVSIKFASVSGGSTNFDTYTHAQDMNVGGAVAGTLGNRFGGGSQRRPSSGGSTVITSSSSSSSSSSGPAGGGLDIRFGGNRPSGAAAGANGAGSGNPPLLAAAAPPRVAAGNSAVNGLAAAQANLENAAQGLQNALNQVLG